LTNLNAVLPTTGSQEDQFPIPDPSVPESPSLHKPPSILSPSKVFCKTLRSPPLPETEPQVLFKDPPPKQELQQCRPPCHFGYDGSQGHGYLSKFTTPTTGILLCFVAVACNLIQRQKSLLAADLAYQTFCKSNFETEMFNFRNPLAYAALTKCHNPDIPNYHKAMCSPNSKGYQEAMAKDIKVLERHGSWTLVPKSLIPKGRHAYLQLGHSRRNNFRMG